MMVEPAPMTAAACFEIQNKAYKLVLSTRSNWSVVISAMPPIWAIWNAALLTTMSRPPRTSTAVSTNLVHCVSSVRSQAIARPDRPAASIRSTVAWASGPSDSR